MNRPYRVLVVDRSEDTSVVLQTALKRMGVRVLAASRIERGVELARQSPPELIVLDAEVSKAPLEELCWSLVEASGVWTTPLVVLGGVWRKPGELLVEEFLPKPYHYAPLIRKIEALLSTIGQTVPLGR